MSALIDYDGSGEKPILASVWTLVLYEQEFGTDLIKDFFGKVEAEEDEGGVILDFTKTNWTSLVRVLWALLKAADDSVPYFTEWSKGITNLNLMELSQDIAGEIQAGFFRTGAGDSL